MRQKSSKFLVASHKTTVDGKRMIKAKQKKTWVDLTCQSQSFPTRSLQIYEEKQSTIWWFTDEWCDLKGSAKPSIDIEGVQDCPTFQFCWSVLEIWKIISKWHLFKFRSDHQQSNNSLYFGHQKNFFKSKKSLCSLLKRLLWNIWSVTIISDNGITWHKFPNQCTFCNVINLLAWKLMF